MAKRQRATPTGQEAKARKPAARSKPTAAPKQEPPKQEPPKQEVPRPRRLKMHHTGETEVVREDGSRKVYHFRRGHTVEEECFGDLSHIDPKGYTVLED